MLLLLLLVFFAFFRKQEPPSNERQQPVERGVAVQGRLAIIIDDLGYDPAAASNVLALGQPLTLAVLPHLPYSASTAEEAHRRGYGVMLHLPMASANGEAKHEQIELRPGMNPEETARTVSAMLETVPHASGVNNHQGSLATSDEALMVSLMAVLRDRGLFFIDSRTSTTTRAYQMARRAGVPAAFRNVFLDDVQTREATLRQLELAVEEAARNGHAIALGHPYPTTMEVLHEVLPQLPSRGIRLVFVSELVQ